MARLKHVGKPRWGGQKPLNGSGVPPATFTCRVRRVGAVLLWSADRRSVGRRDAYATRQAEACTTNNARRRDAYPTLPTTTSWELRQDAPVPLVLLPLVVSGLLFASGGCRVVCRTIPRKRRVVS